MKSIMLMLSLVLTLNLNSQSTYETEDGTIHLLGNIDLKDLENPPYAEWYSKSTLNSYTLQNPENLKDVEVRIFMGTWCGDTKKWLPEFIHLWKENGLSEDQLTITTLHSEGDQYKRSPEGEEEFFHIHRVPTFIFTKDNKEIGRIVESPLNDLLTDVDQIASGLPSKPRYRAASHFYQVIEQETLDSLLTPQGYEALLATMSTMVTKFNELNTLGYVLEARCLTKEAELAFRINKDLFPYEPNTWFSMGNMYYDQGMYKESEMQFIRVLELKPDSRNTKEMLKKIKERT